MKNVVMGAVLLGCGLAANQAQAACPYPVGPGKFPDGSVASRDEIKAAKDLVVKYNADMDAYLVCINSEHEAKVAAQANVSPEQKAEMERMHVQKQQAALKEVTDITERFNEQLRAWKAKNAAEKKGS
jgi:hypothetical protein